MMGEVKLKPCPFCGGEEMEQMFITTENRCIERYTDRNVSQCWSCKNCVGSIDAEAVFNLGEKKRKVLLPECCVADMYITSVDYNPCPYYGRKEE